MNTAKAESRSIATDPFTSEIIKSAFRAAADEMFFTMQRTARSPIIYEVLDFGVGVTDKKGTLVSMGYGVPFLLSALESLVTGVIEKHGVENMQPGDVFISNDTYGCAGTHLNDIGLVMPIYFEGRHVAFTAVNAHWTDVGGKDPGIPPDSHEIFQEGFQIPNIKLFDGGEPIQGMFDLIEANVRVPEMSMGDLWASIAALRVGERRMLDLYGRYGEAALDQAMQELFDYGEEMIRLELKKLPKGEFEAEDWIDDDGLGNGPLKIKVKVTISDDEFIVDYTDSAPQAEGPINVSKFALPSAVKPIFHAVTNPSIIPNGGCYRALKIISPEGSVFGATRPAPVATYFEGMAHAAELMCKALAPHVPDRLTAGQLVSTCVTIIAGPHPETKSFYVYVETLPGGWGAGHDKDGVHGAGCVANGETYNIPVEVKEAKFGFRVGQYAFHNDAGGEGEFRGGKGLALDYEITSDFAILTGIFGRTKTRPWSLDNGNEGTTNYVTVTRADGSQEHYGRAANVPLKKGDRVRLVTATGGGYGDPENRSRDKVLADVKDGYVTPDQARDIYGVDAGSVG